jgi:hypothetical protein
MASLKKKYKNQKTDKITEKKNQSEIISKNIKTRSYTLRHATSPFFVLGLFETGSLELFAWVGFEL